MTNEQLRMALIANAVTRSNRIGFDFQDPAGKTLDEYTKEAMMQCVRVAQKMRQPGLDKELAGQVFPIYTIGNWAREKVVYDFDKDFQELLMDTDDIVIHHEILERLAFKDFYLPLYDSKDYCGMFVHIEFEPKTKDTFIGIVLVGGVANEKENYAFLSLPAWIKEGQTLTEATRSTKQYIEKAANQRSTTDVAVPDTMEEIPPVYNEGTPYVRLAMLCAYYLASKGSDVHLNPIKKEDRQPFMFKGKAQRVNVKVFTVGDHVAEKYKNEGDGKAPRWRHYWGGNGRERRECKFSF